MSIPTDQLLAGIKVLERIKTNLQWQIAHFRDGSEPAGQGKQAFAQTSSAEITVTDQADVIPFNPEELPCLEKLIAGLEKIIPGAVLLGSCEDGVPLQIELKNPAPGSILITGDPGCGKTRLLRSILASAARLNQPDEVAFCIIASNPDEYTDLAEELHCQSLLSSSEPGAGRMLKELSKELESRQAGQIGPTIILAIDDVASLTARIDREAFSRLIRMVKHGPRYRIWPLTTLSVKDIHRVDQQLLDAFRTHLIGYISDTRLASYLARDPNGDSSYLISGRQFSVPVSGAWLTFWICDPCESENMAKEEGNGNRDALV